MAISVIDYTQQQEGAWQSDTLSERVIQVTTPDLCKANGVTWKISKNNGQTYGSNAPDFNDGNTHLAKMDIGFGGGEETARYVLSDDTTTGLDGTELKFSYTQGDQVIVVWTIEDEAGNTTTFQSRIRHDLTTPDAPAIKVYTDSTKTVEIEDGGWIGTTQPYIEFEGDHDPSRIAGVSYTVSGDDPDDVDEKDFTDLNYDMENDPAPSN